MSDSETVQRATQRKKVIRRHTDLEVYQLAFGTAMKVFEFSKSFPTEERYSLTDQMRRSSRSVCSNLADAWRKRRHEAAFISKLSDSEGEAAETQVWLQFATKCGYLAPETARALYRACDDIIGKLVQMSSNPKQWTLR
jgi:four helix bundle protein